MCVSEPLPRRREGEKERRKPEDEEKGGKRLKRTEKDDKGHQRQMNTLGLFPGRLPERIGGSARLVGVEGATSGTKSWPRGGATQPCASGCKSGDEGLAPGLSVVPIFS